jgi:acetamidase/formamidase
MNLANAFPCAPSVPNCGEPLTQIKGHFVETVHSLRAGVGTVHRGFFDAALPAVLTINSGDGVALTTLSANEDELPPPEAGFAMLPEHKAVLAGIARGEGPHFMTGPIAVAGAVPGDELVVEIIEVGLLQDWGWNVIAPHKGTLPQHFPRLRRIHVSIDRARGIVTMPWGLELRTAPFFGIIGVAPPPVMGRVTSNIPRAFGGNMDNTNLRPGAKLHLPVFNPGGLLSIGDGHAMQGDGEVCLTALETALSGMVRITLEKATGIERPWAETPSHLITMAFDPDLDLAAESAVHEMIKTIVRLTGLAAEDAYTLCSIAADVHVTQLVAVHKGIHVMLPKAVLRRA